MLRPRAIKALYPLLSAVQLGKTRPDMTEKY